MSLYIAALIFPSTLTGLLSFCCQKTPLPSAATTTMLHCRDGIDQVRSGAWFLPDMMLNQWAKSFSLDYRTLVHMVYEIFRCLKVNFRLTVMCLLLRNGFCLASPSYRPDWSNVSEIIVLLEGSPFSSKPSWSSDEWMNEWASGSWSPLWLKPSTLITQNYLVASSSESCGVFWISSFYGWWRPLCSLGPLVLQSFFFTVPQICASILSCHRGLQTIPCSDMRCHL